MPLSLVLQGRQVLERPVRPLLIIFLSPNLHLRPRIRHILEPMHIQARRQVRVPSHTLFADTLRTLRATVAARRQTKSADSPVFRVHN